MAINRQTFTIPKLLVVAARGDEADGQGNLRRFCAALVKAGYLRRVPGREMSSSADTSNGYAQFRVIKHTGPLAPVHRIRARTLFDHNTGEEVAL